MKKENTRKPDTDEHRRYIILDAALWDIEISPAFSFDNQYCCLFATRGAEHELDAVAPYLFEYTEGDELSNWVRYKELKGKKALHLLSTLSMEHLRKHLRRFLRVKTESGKWCLFRFYDPEVAHTAIPAFTDEQHIYFFRGIESLTYFQSKTDRCDATLTPDRAKHEELQEAAKEKDLLPFIISNVQFKAIKEAMTVFFHQKMFYLLKESRYIPDIPESRIYAIIEKQTRKLVRYHINDENNSRIFIETSFRYPVLCEERLPDHLDEIMLRYADETRKIQAVVNYLNSNNYAAKY